MKLIVGLGNPGRRYEATRHNIGFDVIAELARRYANGNPKTRFQGETIDATWDGRSYLLLLPQTFMNLSGSSVVAARDFYQLEAADILVVCDDFNLPLGQLRLRARGSAGGQKGLADIISR
ncbi:MAG: aminoacyl-tRNA hydrolase, partial [Planctomycetales bacterium]|nr:aminoacyl-tRNA hydrolase [Planctomycetales bacterium]